MKQEDCQAAITWQSSYNSLQTSHKVSPLLSQKGGQETSYPSPFSKGRSRNFLPSPFPKGRSRNFLPSPFPKGRGRGGVWTQQTSSPHFQGWGLQPQSIQQCDISQQTLTRKLKKNVANFCVTTQPWLRLSCGMSLRDVKLVA